jgi:EAL domain-containing protein (putative c-di-GMP-specific phosphodiesterase class I)
MGILPPAKFLNILEHSGDIYWVGLWAFEQLVRQYQQLKLMFPDNDFLLSMNLSPKQLLNPELINEFKRILLKHNEDASSFCMEIVEFAMFDKVEIIQENILRLRQMGFKIAIDNYGLEFATISLLDSLPIDIIKLDKNFFGKKEGSFVKNIIEMLNKHAREKNMKIIAEGVEDADALNLIKELKINYGQGYYFSKPVSVDDLIEGIKENLSEALKETNKF